MWRLIFLVAFVHILEVSTRSVDPLEGPLWSQTIGDQEYVDNDDMDIMSKRDNSYEDSNETEINLNQRHELQEPTETKRALSMFARWGPIGTIGKDRVPIRSNFAPDDISTQTRSRIGQPLRWG